MQRVFFAYLSSKLTNCLTYNDLSHANIASLRRNNIAFQSPARPYVSAIKLTGSAATGASIRERGTVMFASIVRFVREWKRYNTSVRELSALGDRELADIGINRSEIPSIAWTACHRR
jgi:uncharacterized protein YjiS (DUF1127 family)